MAERLIVVPVVEGSSPFIHPIKIRPAPDFSILNSLFFCPISDFFSPLIVNI